MNARLAPYLTGSLAFHLALAAAAVTLLGRAASPPRATVYTIDFVGAAANAGLSDAAARPAAAKAAPAPPARPLARTRSADFARRRRKRFKLPRPSLYDGEQASRSEAAPAAAATQPAAQAASAPGPSAGPGTDASADMPNFPYPWYISRVRQMLWEQWRRRMPHEAAECVVVFSLLPRGGIVDLRTETSSGDESFDLAALAAVQDAAPYPPLPSRFTEPFLKIHVTLRSGG
ncbi:MAG: TonB family protein [Elusimicrobia bacterium]|nr:TonB family protein [Elusimicrobiota bacterium]MDE2236755.1 TonB family protein [Elusimicrobiota bacterium]MDE2425579.1 TonB family protein [Elusimicrobiota bacterium]